MVFRHKYYKKTSLKTDLENNVQGTGVVKFSDKDQNQDFVSIALEVWKIEKKIKKIKEKFGEEVNQGFEYPLTKIHDILEKKGIKTIDYTGKKYIEGMNGIDIVSVEKNESLLEPIILDTISPLIEEDGIISQRSKVIILSN